METESDSDYISSQSSNFPHGTCKKDDKIQEETLVDHKYR